MIWHMMNQRRGARPGAEVRGCRSGFLWRISGIAIVAGWSLFIIFALIAINLGAGLLSRRKRLKQS
jgi:hypothetical protein